MNYVFTFDSINVPSELLTEEAVLRACVDCGSTAGTVLRWETDDGRIEYAHWPSCQPMETPHAELATVAA